MTEPMEVNPPWQNMSSAPQDESTFLAAVLVHNSRTQRDHWEYALMFFSEGRFLFCDEADTGWHADDYTHWMPIKAPSRPVPVHGPAVILPEIHN